MKKLMTSSNQPDFKAKLTPAAFIGAVSLMLATGLNTVSADEHSNALEGAAEKIESAAEDLSERAKSTAKSSETDPAASLADTQTPDNPENTVLSGETAATSETTASTVNESEIPSVSGDSSLTGGASATSEEPAVVQAPPREEAGIEITKTNLKASDFIGAKVKNLQGDNLGEITDLMINWPESKMNYAILSYGGVAGIGAELYAVPIDQLKAASQGNVLVLNVSKSALENAEGFDEERPPEMANVDLFQPSGESSEFSSMQEAEEDKSLLEKAAEKLSGKSSDN